VETGSAAASAAKARANPRSSSIAGAFATASRSCARSSKSSHAGLDTSTLALIGYTNAGKSSLMRGLSGDEVHVADQLFATLDTTVRALKPETRPRILVSDTVGFIHKLPHDLVASFRSTLAEARDASLLLHVVDSSDAAFRDQLAVTLDVLADIDAANHPRLLILNKADRLDATQIADLAREFPEALIMSARSPEDVAQLHARVVAFFEDRMQEAEFVIPYDQQRHVQVLHERSRVIEEQYDQAGAKLRVRAPEAVLASLRREFSED
jgi:GTP-binding protein HflX